MCVYVRREIVAILRKAHQILSDRESIRINYYKIFDVYFYSEEKPLLSPSTLRKKKVFVILTHKLASKIAKYRRVHPCSV